MARIKVKIATDTLTLQIHKAKFSKNVESSAKCLLCLDESEDITLCKLYKRMLEKKCSKGVGALSFVSFVLEKNAIKVSMFSCS
jgi:hypothetical protein